MRGRPCSWTPSQEATIKRMRADGEKIQAIADHLGKTYDATASHISEMRLPRAARRKPDEPVASQDAGFWTRDITERVKTMWADGKSAGVIAREIKTSRNAVIGKLHRLGLKRPAPAGRVRMSPQKPVAGKPSRLVANAFPQLVKTTKSQKGPRPVRDERPMAADPGPGIVRFLDRSSKQCAWPKWSDDTPLAEKICCGQPIEEGRHYPYCAHHLRLNTGLGSISERTALRAARAVLKKEAA
jgi:hypothetical protein